MIVFYLVFGMVIGSFLNVVILRLPEGKNVAYPSSHCYSCEKPLKWYHNIPVFSWVFLSGKCAYCKTKISYQYPLVELFCGVLFALCFLKHGDFYHSMLNGLIFSCLLALALIDLRYKAVPDALSLPTMILAFFVHPFSFTVPYGLMFAGGFALLRMLVSFVLKKEAMGEADIIIAVIIGVMLGSPLGLVAIYIGAVISLPAFMIVKKKGFELPFIPFLLAGLLITYLFDAQFLALIKEYYG